MKKTILVTGASGFLGSHLCELLLTNGDRVIGVDNFFTSDKRNLDSFKDHENFMFIEHDIIDPLFVDEPIQQVYNLACPASPIHYQKNAVRTVKANTIGVINILGLARSHGARVFQASTSEVYGDPEVHPQPEEYVGAVNPIGPRACYDEGKRVAETLFYEYFRMHGMEVKIVRIFNTYGPRMAFDDGRVVSNFIIQALRGDDITIYGDGTQTRSFCYVSDLVDGFVRMMNAPAEIMGPINLGNPTENTIAELAQEVITLTGSKSKLVYQPLPQDDPKRRRPDISKAKEVLDWEPQVALADGLAKTIEEFKTRM